MSAALSEPSGLGRFIKSWAPPALQLTRELCAHLVLRKWWWLVGVSALFTLNFFFTLGFNASQSLPQHVFLVHKRDHALKAGDLVTFRWHGGGPYLAGVKFTKIVRGVPGDVVTLQGRDVFINGQFVAKAKYRATTGQPLELGPAGVIPPGRYYVHGLHPDSLDSRYAITGWIAADQVVGKSIALF